MLRTRNSPFKVFSTPGQLAGKIQRKCMVWMTIGATQNVKMHELWFGRSDFRLGFFWSYCKHWLIVTNYHLYSLSPTVKLNNKDVSYTRMSVLFYDLKKAIYHIVLIHTCINLGLDSSRYTYVIQYMVSLIIASTAPVSKRKNLQIHQEKLFGSIPCCFLKEYSCCSASHVWQKWLTIYS